MQKKAEGLLEGLLLAAVLTLSGIGISNSYTEQGGQTIYSAVTDGMQAALQTLGEKVEAGIRTVTADTGRLMQAGQEILMAAREKAEAQETALSEELMTQQTEEEALTAQQTEAEAVTAQQTGEGALATARPSGEVPVTSQAGAVAPGAVQGDSETEAPAMPQDSFVVIEEEKTAAAAPGNVMQGENAGEDVVQEKMTASQLMQCINAERSNRGLAQLVWSDDLAAAAGTRSIEAVSRFEHIRPDGTDFFTVSELAMAENLARGNLQTTAQEIVDKWMESAGGHKQNILDSGLYTVGISIYEKDGKLTICVLFG